MAVLSQHWKDAIISEDKLRLEWFKKNESALLASIQKPFKSGNGEAFNAELSRNRKDLFSKAEKFPKISRDDPPNQPVDLEGCENIMRPVPPEVTQLIYNSSNKGRITYLKDRCRVLPENRYYFPETTSFRYGWKMWDCAKTMQDPRYGKSAIIRQSFYRRRAGIEKDPDHYITPAKLSPTVCNNS